jgi:hypothetical protein
MRSHEQHPAVVMAEARVGVQQVSGAVQRDDRLAGTRTPVDHECALGAGADDRVLLGRDGAEHVLHARRAAAAEARDEGGVVVRHGLGDTVRTEDLVPVVRDATRVQRYLRRLVRPIG